MTDSDPDVLTTARLLVRPPQEADRERFVELFSDEDFMVFYPGLVAEKDANDRFDHMIAVCRAIPFGKQPVVGGRHPQPLHPSRPTAAGPGR